MLTVEAISTRSGGGNEGQVVWQVDFAMLGRVMHATARMSPPVKSRTGVTCQRTVRGARILAFGARRPSPEPTLLRFSSDLRAELRASTMSVSSVSTDIHGCHACLISSPCDC